nr:MAG TPA: hypothetical protein [Caudoviricetes sp.]
MCSWSEHHKDTTNFKMPNIPIKNTSYFTFLPFSKITSSTILIFRLKLEL